MQLTCNQLKKNIIFDLKNENELKLRDVIRMKITNEILCFN